MSKGPASNGHFLTQMPQPMHRSSEMYAIFEVLPTSMHILPARGGGVRRGGEASKGRQQKYANGESFFNLGTLLGEEGESSG